MAIHENGNGASGWRWTIGILLTIQGAVIGWLAVGLSDLQQQVYQGSERSTRELLEERTKVYVPIILENRTALILLERDMNRLQYRVEQLEKRQ